MKQQRGLGRGLDALLPAAGPPRRPEPGSPAPEGAGQAALTPPGQAGSAEPGNAYRGNVFSCPLEKIVPQKGQPRQHFDSASLDELAQSIKIHGLLEPLVVRRRGDDQFELIAGERRWRACQRAGLREALVVVHDVSSLQAFELAIIENVQREDLDPIELAEALQRLIAEHGYTQEKLAERLGKDRSTIANSLRLLRLPEDVRDKVVSGELSEGHGRALLSLEDPKRMAEVAQKVILGRLSVRQTEELVRGAKASAGSGGRGGSSKDKAKSASVRDLEKRLERKLGARCEVKDKAGHGEILIRYSSLDELDRLLELIL
jgi:ParB family transcriptional regulator, chromosome partitioning protein